MIGTAGQAGYCFWRQSDCDKYFQFIKGEEMETNSVSNLTLPFIPQAGEAATQKANFL